MHNLYKKILLILCAGLFNICAISLFGPTTLSFPLLGVTLITLMTNKQTAFIWALVTGIIMEIYSPFPTLAYFLTILSVFAILRVFIIKYMSNRAIFGAMASSALGVLCFEIILKIFADISAFIGAGGWLPIFNQSYLWFILTRLLYNTLAVSLIFLILRQFSTQVRGVAIHNIKVKGF